MKKIINFVSNMNMMMCSCMCMKANTDFSLRPNPIDNL